MVAFALRVVVVVLLFVPCAAVFAGDSVLATVGGEPIHAREVDALLEAARRRHEVDAAAVPELRRRLLQELIARRLALAYAQRTGTGAGREPIDEAVGALRAQLQRAGTTLEAHLAERGQTPADLRRELAWSLTWRKYLEQYLTDERLKAHFQSHRRSFDGTEIEVSQILLRLREQSAEARNEAVEKARGIREQVLGGIMTFAEAARRHSQAPSAQDGGRLGWIGRRGPMTEPFTAAAFALSEGEISPPVVTGHGVHLIRCDAVRPGNRTWTEVREELSAALARELLEKLARHERAFTAVQVEGRDDD
ncbi:MAG: peptidylprolyl isomerase [Thermoguttaceae bacterium]|jgi:parvulin-like peptidyl-prolyl isomerase|nr:peptidylprolyl isomerase [Thermoguttaceae bacterium]